MSRSKTAVRLEVLEDRRAPATMVNGQTVTWQDANGNTATAAFSKPVVTADNENAVFTFDTGSVNSDNSAKQQLQKLDLTGLPKGLSVTITGKDGTAAAVPVDVGFVNAAGLDEKAITISGDLGRAAAGDANLKTPGLGSLSVGSLGGRGTATQAAGGNLTTAIAGSVGKLTISGDDSGAFVTVNGSIGKITVGGSLKADGSMTTNNGSILATGNLGKATITGDIAGGPADQSGILTAYGNVGIVTVGGNLTGAGGVHSGRIESGKKMKSVTITGSVTGGAGSASAEVRGDLGLGKVTVGGSVTGAGGDNSAIITGGDGNLGKVFIGGNLAGGTGVGSATVGGVKVAGVTVKGDVIGMADQSGQIYAYNGIGPVVLGGLTGGAGKHSGEIDVTKGSIGTVTVLGSVQGGGGQNSGDIFSYGKLGKVHITGDLVGGSGVYSGTVSGSTMAGITVDGSVTGGTATSSGSILAVGNIGPVVVGKNFTGASIVTGFGAGLDGFFGTADDYAFTDAKGNPLVAKITSITIGGTADGTATAGDHFAFEATQIGAVSINGSKLALKPGPKKDNMALGTQGDFTLVEK